MRVFGIILLVILCLIAIGLFIMGALKATEEDLKAEREANEKKEDEKQRSKKARAKKSGKKKARAEGKSPDSR